MQAGRQAGGLAGRQPLTFEMLRCIVLDGLQSKLLSGENGVIASGCVWWRVAVPVYLLVRARLYTDAQSSVAKRESIDQAPSVTHALQRLCMLRCRPKTSVIAHASQFCVFRVSIMD